MPCSLSIQGRDFELVSNLLHVLLGLSSRRLSDHISALDDPKREKWCHDHSGIMRLKNSRIWGISIQEWCDKLPKVSPCSQLPRLVVIGSTYAVQMALVSRMGSSIPRGRLLLWGIISRRPIPRCSPLITFTAIHVQYLIPLAMLFMQLGSYPGPSTPATFGATARREIHIRTIKHSEFLSAVVGAGYVKVYCSGTHTVVLGSCCCKDPSVEASSSKQDMGKGNISTFVIVLHCCWGR
jgi:hypothetical protein